jgi:hypothetical protein
MYSEYFLTIVVVVSLATPSFAATTYYIGQDTKSNKCSVVTKQPDGGKMMQVGPDSYKTKAEAAAALKSAPECQN